MIYLYAMTKGFYLTYYVIPMIGFIILRCFIYSLDQNTVDCNAIIDFVKKKKFILILSFVILL